MVKMQMKGKDKSKKVPIGFKDGRSTSIPKEYYDAMKDFFIGEKWDGKYIDKDNFGQFIKNNPELVNEFLSRFDLGFIESDGTETSSNNDKYGFPYNMSQIPVNEFNKIDITKNNNSNEVGNNEKYGFPYDMSQVPVNEFNKIDITKNSNSNEAEKKVSGYTPDADIEGVNWR